VRWRSVGLTADATPTSTSIRRERDPYRDPHDVNKNSWERGIATDHRGVPYCDETGEPIGIKRWGETYRRKFQEAGMA
jgi:hypothetical protein